jgi:8-oxo-dGTP pyrophosphatase MutT (NUDIX family)
MSEKVAVPRPAATVILLRGGGKHRDRRLEVLLARRTDAASFMPGVWVFPGGALDPDELDGRDPDEAHRTAATRELAEEVGVEIDPTTLEEWSRWITPEPVAVRFDTRFYVAMAPAHCRPEPDATEITDVAWLAPREALDRHRRRELKLVFPTVKNLEALAGYDSAHEVMAAAAASEVEPILPKVVGTAEDWRVVLPGDPDYPD